MRILLLFILCFSLNSFAAAPKKAISSKKIASLVNKEKPSLGNCSEYSDYYIYKCTPFKCKLPIAKLVETSRIMEVLQMNDDICYFNYQFVVRDPKYPPTEIKFKCKLSEKGRLEMANQFTKYKEGDISMYMTPPQNPILNQECTLYY